LIDKLAHLDSDNAHRKLISNHYCHNLTEIPGIELLTQAKGTESAWHLFVIKTNEREKLMKVLDEDGIQTMIHYPIPPHNQQAYADQNFPDPFPISQMLHAQVVSIPMGPTLTLSDADLVIKSLKRFSKSL